MKSTKQKPTAVFSCDELPVAVIISHQQTGRIISYNHEARKLLGLPAKTGRALTIKKIRPLGLPSKPIKKTNTYVRYASVAHKTVSGKNVSLTVLRKPMIHQNVKCYFDFLEDTIELNELKESIGKTSLDAFISIDEHQTIHDWNSMAENIFGWKKKEVLGHKLVDFIVPKVHQARHQAGFKNYINTGRSTILNKLIEITAIDKSGREFPIELIVTHAKENGRHFFYSFIRDISTRKQAEETLIDSENKLKKSQSIAGIGSWEMHGNFSEVYWSDEFYRMHGLQPQSVKPSTRLRLSMVHPHDRAKLEKAINGALKEGKPYSIEKRIVLPNKEVRWVLSTRRGYD